MSNWLRNALLIALGLFFYCFGSIQWHPLTPGDDPLRAGRIAFEWKLPEKHAQPNKAQQNVMSVWGWLSQPTQQLQQQAQQQWNTLWKNLVSGKFPLAAPPLAPKAPETGHQGKARS